MFHEKPSHKFRFTVIEIQFFNQLVHDRSVHYVNRVVQKDTNILSLLIRNSKTMFLSAKTAISTNDKDKKLHR